MIDGAGITTMRRIDRIVWAAILWLALAAPACATANGVSQADYRIHVLSMDPLRLAVDATLPSNGDRLIMSRTRPGDIAPVDANGWPAIVAGLEATDADGHALALAPTGADGWRLAQTVSGPVTLRYTLDYAPFAKLGWPAPRESAYMDAEAIVIAGRSLFVTTPAQSTSRVVIDPPPGWHVAAPWPADSDDRSAYRADSVDALADNLFAMTRTPPERIAAGRFRVDIVAIGPWQAVRADVRRIIGPIARRYVEVMPVAESQAYAMVLLPQREHGGESFRNSFAMNFDAVPSRENIADWGNTLAHELFHFWNGWRLRGSDYMATQWFQEGFTEYMANKSLLSAGLIAPDEFLHKLAQHEADYRRIATPLDAPGTHKGPPLYGGGALVAFLWDVRIRAASSGRRDLRDLFAALWTATDHGAKEYDWNTIHTALDGIAKNDWMDFHARYISAQEPLPLEDALRALGLRPATTSPSGEVDGLVPDSAATPAARRAWADFIAR